jgi:hypothetical protein
MTSNGKKIHDRKPTACNSQGFVGLAKPTMNPLLKGTAQLPQLWGYRKRVKRISRGFGILFFAK